MNLNEGKWIRDFPEFIESENEGKIYAKPPETYGKVPELREVEGLVKFTFEEIENYFREARQAELRLHYFQGIPVHAKFWWECLMCDYCRTFIRDMTFQHCLDCGDDMCDLCYSEVDEQTALKNGAKNWHKRKERLDQCRNHQLIRITYGEINCDQCKKNHGGIVFSNREEDYDLCQSCAKEYPEEIREHSLIETDLGPSFEMQLAEYYGSFTDWIPLYKDEDWNLVLMNLNPTSKYYQRVSLASIDDHSRMGFHIIDDSFETILDKLEAKDIQRYMQEHHMKTHFG